MKKTSLTVRLLVLGLSLTVIPLVVLTLFIRYETGQVSGEVRDALVDSGKHQLEIELESVMTTINISQRLLLSDVNKVLGVAENALESSGGIQFDVSFGEVTWEAVNQFSGRSQILDLPVARLGTGEVFEPEKRFDVRVPIVDSVGEITGDTATLFQRMNPQGDMLRIATNVSKEGSRAVGTYIPATNPDGRANPVIKEVLSGRTFRGRAFVVDQWYVTVYKPIKDASGKVTGILYVGTPEGVATDPILDRLAEVTIGKTGYLFILNARGKDAGRYVLSAGRKSDGEVILDARDSDGRAFIQEMVDTALEADAGTFSELRYPWMNPGDLESRDKVALYSYFPDWDWIVAASAYEEEFYEQVEEIEQRFGSMITLLMMAVLILAIFAAVIFIRLTRSVTVPIEGIIAQLSKGSEETSEAADNVSSSSQELAGGASSQAENLDRISESMKQLEAQVGENTLLVEETLEDTAASDTESREGVKVVRELVSQMKAASAAVQAMTQVIGEIRDSSESVSKIIGTIDDIAFQTNILALNASVEAARAGDAGAGFAVVAEEVRNLAGRAAGAASETGRLIQQAVETSHRGSTASSEVAQSLELVNRQSTTVNEVLEKLAVNIERINKRMETIQGTSQAQNKGITEVTVLVQEANDVTQNNAAGAEETASAAEELTAQSVALSEVVEELRSLIRGS